MLKRVFVSVFAVVVLGVCFASAALALTGDWTYKFTLQGFNTSYFGTKPGAFDGTDPYDHLYNPEIYIPEATIIAVGSRRITDPDPQHLYDRDYLSPIAAGQTKSWTIRIQYLRVGQIPVPPNQLTLLWQPVSGDVYSSNLRTKLFLIGSGGLIYTDPTVWDLTGGQFGSVTLPWGPATPPYQSYYPSYTFRLEATAVPEPSSLVTLCSGLGGMLMFVKRRN